MVAPIVSENVTIKVPNHFPKIKPPNKKIGLPNPNRRTQIIVKKMNKKIVRKKLFCLTLKI